MNIERFCQKAIEICFYAVFFFVPIVFVGDTSELFEFNKLWLTFDMAILIGVFWITKMILQKRIWIQRTPLDIPIILFLVSQIISTVISMDPHVSWWGYYSRFNGGLFSLLTYVFLYYAFVSNNTFSKKSQTTLENSDTPNTSFSFLTRTYLYILAAVIFAVGFYLSVLPSISDPSVAGSRAWILVISMICSFALFVKALPGTMVIKSLYISLTSGLIVSLWGLPSHFGYDPTCLLFRGQFDVKCWTDAFQPTIRIFSTLGQPDWMAAYLAILIPIAITLGLKIVNMKYEIANKQFFLTTCYILLATLFYTCVLFTAARSGILGLGAGIVVFLGLLVIYSEKNRLIQLGTLISGALFYVFWLAKVAHQTDLLGNLALLFLFLYICGVLYSAFCKRVTILFINKWLLLILIGVTLILSLAIGTQDTPPLSQTLAKFSAPTTAQTAQPTKPQTQQPSIAGGEFGGSDSGKIRKIVWRGAWEIWKHNPIFGTGVETYAFAYYQYRPQEHNLVSEWDYLYNKAHNEYLNYLATTGIVGLGTYLVMIAWFLFFTVRGLIFNKSTTNEEAVISREKLLAVGLTSGYVTILVTNFFGFSVVIANLYLFLIPALVLYLLGEIHPAGILSWRVQQPFEKNPTKIKNELSYIKTHKLQEKEFVIGPFSWMGIVAVSLLGLFLLHVLNVYWEADKKYSMASNLDKSSAYTQAYPLLHEAVKDRDDEPVFKDELVVNDAVIAAALYGQHQATTAAQLAEEAINTSDYLVQTYPHNILFWKTRVKLFTLLAESQDERWYQEAIKAIKNAAVLAPTDAKVSYTMGVLYGKNGDYQKAVETLEHTIVLKPNYEDAYMALGLFYHALAVDKNNRVINPLYEQKAVDALHKIYIGSDGKPSKAVVDLLHTWGEE